MRPSARLCQWMGGVRPKKDATGAGVGRCWRRCDFTPETCAANHVPRPYSGAVPYRKKSHCKPCNLMAISEYVYYLCIGSF